MEASITLKKVGKLIDDKTILAGLSFGVESGWKIKYLSQFESSPGSAIKDYWDLDETSLLIIADPRGGNLLNFNVGEAYFSFMPRLFWVELQTRFGNQYYVKEHGY